MAMCLIGSIEALTFFCPRRPTELEDNQGQLYLGRLYLGKECGSRSARLINTCAIVVATSTVAAFTGARPNLGDEQ
jgi:hypothetical protein